MFLVNWHLGIRTCYSSCIGMALEKIVDQRIMYNAYVKEYFFRNIIFVRSYARIIATIKCLPVSPGLGRRLETLAFRSLELFLEDVVI